MSGDAFRIAWGCVRPNAIVTVVAFCCDGIVKKIAKTQL